MIGAPIGSRLADLIPEVVLLSAFAGLMVLISVRMWFKANEKKAHLPIIADNNEGPTCRRDPEGRLRLNSQCAMLLGVVGLCTGILTGMFGVEEAFILPLAGNVRRAGNTTGDRYITSHHHPRCFVWND